MSVRTEYHVTGMTCAHCVQTVSGAVGALPSVRDVTVELSNGLMSVDSEAPLDRGAVDAAVRDAGYSLAPAAG